MPSSRAGDFMNISGYAERNVAAATIPCPRNGIDSFSATSSNPMFSYRLEADGVDCFPWVNDAFARLCGTEPAQLAKTAAPLLNKIHPHDWEVLQESFRESALTLKPLRTLLRLHRRVGRRTLAQAVCGARGNGKRTALLSGLAY